MLTSFSYAGEWRLPSSPDTLQGTLHFDPADGARLELFGVYRIQDHKLWSPEIILGDTTKGLITLVDCSYRHSSRSGSNIITSIYTPSMILVGEHFENKAAIQFTDVYFEAFNLFEWIDKRSLRYKQEGIEPSGPFSIHYTRPKPIPFTYHEHCKGSIYFTSATTATDSPHQIKTKESCAVHLRYDAYYSYQHILRDVTIFYQFISLCTFEQSYPTFLFFTSPDITSHFQHEAIDKTWNKQLHCHFSNSYYKPRYKVRRSYEHILRYPKMKKIFPKVIANWYRYYQQIEQAFILHLRFFEDKYTMSTAKFMDQARAMEIFHRRTCNNVSMAEELYTSLLERTLHNDGLTKKEKEWLRTKLQYGNEPSLRQRLKELLSKSDHPLLTKFIRDKKSFIEAVVFNRNYYTHFSKRPEEKPLENLPLFILTEKLLLLLTCSIFDLLEIPYELFEESLGSEFVKRVRE